MNEIFNVDCVEFMSTLQDGSVDLVVTDPPYKLTSRVEQEKQQLTIF